MLKNKLLQNKLLNRSFWIILLLVAWQLTAMSGAFSPMLFPPLDVIFKVLCSSIVNGEILNETLYSLILIFKGLLLGLAGAVLLSVLATISKTFEGFVETLTSIAHPLPGVALLPLVIIWFGTGTNSIVVIIIHSVLWPMTLNIMTGFKSVPRIYKEVGRNFGLSQSGVIKDIMFPYSLPFVFTGFKIGWARAWRAIISAEMIFGAVGGKGGLGWYIFKQRVFMDTPGMFAGLLVIVIIGIVVEDILMNKIENITIKKWGAVI